MSHRGSYHGGSTIIRLSNSPDKSWAEEYATNRRNPLGNNSVALNNVQIETRIKSIHKKISEKDKRLTREAFLQSSALVKRCDLSMQEDKVRSRLVTALIGAELAELFVKIVVGPKGHFVADRTERWSKIAEARARVIWKQQFPDQSL